MLRGGQQGLDLDGGHSNEFFVALCAASQFNRGAARPGAVARSRHWAYLCAKLVARGREHLERAEAG